MSFTIYCHMHESGKRYVGVTAGTMEHRWSQHISLARLGKGGCRAFYAALRKYGPETFTHEVLEVVSELTDASTTEAKWIGHFRCQTPNGYNIEPGGRVRVFSEETRQRLRDAALKREASKTPEERRKAALKREAAKTPEQYQEAALKRAVTMTPEKRAEAVLKRAVTMTPEKRAEVGVKISASLTPEHRARSRENMRMLQASRTPEQRRSFAKLAVAARNAKRTRTVRVRS